ncbi:MAG: RNA-protein complex protein Nop10 [Thermoplasmata archaeon]
MRSAIRRCKSCEKYTLKDLCPSCGGRTRMAIPPRYSPEDRYGEYRRKLKKLEVRS